MTDLLSTDIAPEKVTVAIVEDQHVIRENVFKFLGFYPHFEVCLALGSIESFLHHLDKDSSFTCDILLLDIGLPPTIF